MKRLAFALLVLPILGLPACGSSNHADVVVSAYPVERLVAAVAGDTLTVRNVTPPGVEPHDFELTSNDLDAMASAKAVFYIGNGFAPAVEKAAKQQNDSAVDVLADLDSLLTGDPHFWQDPTLYKQALNSVQTTLGAKYPEHADVFKTNAEAFAKQLDDLDLYAKNKLKTCERRSFVTAHEAFAYLARRYDLEQIAITGISPEAEPDAKRLAELKTEVKNSGATVIFTEELVSPEVAKTLAREVGVRTEVLNPIEGLTKQQIADSVTYESLFKENIDKLANALECRP